MIYKSLTRTSQKLVKQCWSRTKNTYNPVLWRKQASLKRPKWNKIQINNKPIKEIVMVRFTWRGARSRDTGVGGAFWCPSHSHVKGGLVAMAGQQQFLKMRWNIW